MIFEHRIGSEKNPSQHKNSFAFFVSQNYEILNY